MQAKKITATTPMSATPAEGSASTPSVWLRPADVVAERYRIEEKLGAGGMGVVYRAIDLELDDTVAIKVLQLREEGEEHRVSRFKQEIKLARRIVHTNVCRIYDFGAWGDLRFVTMELLDGRSLDEVMRSDLDLDRHARLELFRGLLAGLEAAHEAGIIHRDIKPQNVMVTGDGRSVLMDFGIARQFQSEEITTTGEVVGTPVYMAPERLLGREVDQRCDIYSLGVILYELMTGRQPFEGNTVFEIAQRQINEPVPAPREVDPDLPPWLDTVILKMLDKDPERRFQTVGEVLSVLSDEQTEVVARRVLVVDDDPDFLKLVEYHLSDRGVEVLSSESGARGLEMAFRDQPDLIILDFQLPEMDGFHIATYLRDNQGQKRTPIFMLTAIHDPQYEKQAARLGIERFFTKPLNVRDFADVVEKRLGTL